VFKGLILKESLVSERVFDLLHIKRSEVWANVPTAVDEQPTTWNAVHVAVEQERIDDVLKALEEDLRSEPIGWYADLSDGNDSYIVFSGRRFNIAKEGKAGAVQHGLSLGIPRSQLDF
jgi:hypothetical protein